MKWSLLGQESSQARAKIVSEFKENILWIVLCPFQGRVVGNTVPTNKYRTTVFMQIFLIIICMKRIYHSTIGNGIAQMVRMGMPIDLNRLIHVPRMPCAFDPLIYNLRHQIETSPDNRAFQ